MGTCVRTQPLSRAWLFMTLWAVAHKIPLSMGFPRQEYWSRLPSPSPGDLPDPGIQPESLSISCIGMWVLYHQHNLASPEWLY